MTKHIPMLLSLGGTHISILYDHLDTCASHTTVGWGWFKRKRRCDCGKPADMLTNDEYEIRRAARIIFTGGHPHG